MTCPICNRPLSLDVLTLSGQHASAKSGDVMLCPWCELPVVVEGESVRIPSLDEVRRIPWEVLAAIGEMQQKIRTAKAGMN